MKKKLATIMLTMSFLSACSTSNDIATDPSLETPSITQTYASKNSAPLNMSDQEVEKLVTANRAEIAKVSQAIFMKYYADEAEVSGFKNDFVDPAFKGGVIFNVLNKSKFARSLLYGISSVVLKKKFAKHDAVDTLPRINDQQSDQLINALKPGDIILCGNDSSFIHAIVYEGNGIIIHSLGSSNPKYWGVVRENIKTYFARSERDKFVALRAKNTTPDDINKEIAFAKKQIGKAYDSMFLINDDDKFYCTELAFRALLAMDHAPRILPHKEKLGWELIANEDFMDSPDLETVWTLGRDRAPIAKINKY